MAYSVCSYIPPKTCGLSKNLLLNELALKRQLSVSAFHLPAGWLALGDVPFLYLQAEKHYVGSSRRLSADPHPLYKARQSMTPEIVNTTYPLYSFCNDCLLGSCYEHKIADELGLKRITLNRPGRALCFTSNTTNPGS
jgi:hypothetical protein